MSSSAQRAELDAKHFCPLLVSFKNNGRRPQIAQIFFDLHRVDSELFDDEGTEFGKPDDAVIEAEVAILEFFVESFKMSKEFDLVGIRICDAAGVLVRRFRAGTFSRT